MMIETFHGESLHQKQLMGRNLRLKVLQKPYQAGNTT